MRSKAYELLYGGAKGGGKSDALLMDSSRHVQNPRFQGLILRRSFPQVQELIDRSHRWFERVAKWHGDLHRWTFRSGAFVEFGHCRAEDDKYNYQGKEYQYIGFDQLEQFTQTMYEFITIQARSSDPKLPCYIRATANPGGVGHAFVKARFIDKCSPDGSLLYFKNVSDEEVETTPDDPKGISRAFIFANIYDNKVLMRNDPKYEMRLDALPEKLRKALKEGDWDSFEGQFFNEWRRSFHVIPEFDNALFHSKFIALDYGYTNPSSVGWYAVLPSGKIIKYRELYVEKQTYESLMHLILSMSVDVRNGLPEKISYCVCDPAIWGDKKHHVEPKEGFSRGESGFDILQKVAGSRFPVIRADNRRIVGWGRVRDYLKAFADEDGHVDTMFQCTESCKNLVRTMPGLVHDDNNPEDLNTDGEDHAADELRYALMSRPIIPKEPVLAVSPAEDFWQRVDLDKRRYHQSRQGELAEVSLGEEGTRNVSESEFNV